MFVSPQIHVEGGLPTMVLFGGGAFGRYLGHDGGALMNRISAIVSDNTILLPFSAVYHVRVYQNVAVCNLKVLSSKLDHASTLISDFQPPEL